MSAFDREETSTSSSGPRFRNFLRRKRGIPNRVADYLSTSLEPVLPSPSPSPQPKAINPRVGSYSIANKPVKELRVGCWLHTDKLRWGRHKTQDTAIMYLTVDTIHESDFDVVDFAIALTFSAAPDDTKPPQNTCRHDTDDPEHIGVSLWGKPAPDLFKDEERRWKFSGHRVAADDGGPATVAHWKWTTLNETSTVADCSDLFCGLALQHEGPSTPIMIQYNIEGHAQGAVEGRGVGYRKPYVFNSKTQNAAPWLLTPKAAVEELSDEDLDKLNDEVLIKYMAKKSKAAVEDFFDEDLPGLNDTLVSRYMASRSPPTSTQQSSLVRQPYLDSATSRVQSAVAQTWGHGYGPLQVGPNSIVIQGDVSFGSTPGQQRQSS